MTNKKHIAFNVKKVTEGKRQNYICYLKANLENAYLTLRRDAKSGAVKVIAHIRGGKTVELGQTPAWVRDIVKAAQDEGKFAIVNSFKVIGGRGGFYGVHMSLAY